MGDGKMDKFHGLSSGGGKWKMGKDVGKLTAARAARRTAFFWRWRSRASSARLPPDISRRKKKKRGKRLRRRGRVRGGGGGECEEKVGGECGLLVWCGAARVACSLDPVLEKKEGDWKNPRLGWSLNRFPGGSMNECKFLKVGHLLLLTLNRRPNNGLVNRRCSTLQR